MEHRKNIPPRKTYVPSSWLIVLTVLVCIGGAGWLGWLFVDDGSDAGPVAGPTAATTSTATPTPTASPSPEPTDDETPTEPTPTPTETSSPPDTDAARDVPVSVLNNSGVQGAARAFSAKVTAAGWTVGGVGNWTGVIPTNTVYYPPAFEAQGRLLAEDLGIDRVLPSVSPMRTNRLTIILSGPQS